MPTAVFIAFPKLRIRVKLGVYAQGWKTKLVAGLKEKATCSSKHILQCLQIAFSAAR
jgi:hypothetical protein